MKTRSGFVSNSSSSSFIIKNLSKKTKTLRDFVMENSYLIELYNKRYSWHNYTLKQVLDSIGKPGRSVEDYLQEFPPNTEIHISFGDHDRTAIGEVYDYILRDGSKKDNKKWYWRCTECRGAIYT